MPKDTKLYDLLNVSPTASESDIRKVKLTQKKTNKYNEATVFVRVTQKMPTLLLFYPELDRFPYQVVQNLQ